MSGGAHFVNDAGRVITVKWGDCVKRIGIDGSPEAIKEVIKSAFGLRTTRPFWLVDECGILRSIERDMPLGSYTVHLDEGLNIRIYLNNAADESPAGAEETTFYAEDDFRDFLQRCGFIALTDLSCCKHVLSISDLHHGEVYQGYKAPAKLARFRCESQPVRIKENDNQPIHKLAHMEVFAGSYAGWL
ncbi:hypothetical protein Cgig2_028782 [Carnegiea gigantea]|uniref:GT-1/4-like C-terminal domain-containing protein n=1 Tax=Carnegiea gigantea TaxID=171969 RepID=A0A9Q1JS77_9CARY|nr:hypothetical protein Cgig2_028782 [Carnegiea gigantea]